MRIGVFSFFTKRLNDAIGLSFTMARVEDGNLDELAQELNTDEYPLPEDRKDKYPLPEDKEGKQVTYKDVDVTIKFKKQTKKDSIADEKRVLFTDSGFGLDSLLYDEARKVLKVPIVLAKEMVYHYNDYDAFRPKEELEAVASYIKGIPVTRGHPDEMIVTDREEVLGWAIDAEFEDDELRAVLEISDKDLIEDIQSGKLKGISPGHFSRLDKAASGDYEGTHYDVTQRDIFIDHIAVVEEGRCSVTDGCGIAIDEEIEDKEIKKKEGDEEEIMEPKVVAKKVEAAIVVAEKIEAKAEEEKGVLEEIKELSDVPAPVRAKISKAITVAEKIETKAKEEVSVLEEVKKTPVAAKVKKAIVVAEKMAEGAVEAKEVLKEVSELKEVPSPVMAKVKKAIEIAEKIEEEVEDKLESKLEDMGGAEGSEEVEANQDEAIARLEVERDELKASLDEIVSAEKEKLVDELKSIQDVKSERQLKKMSLDGLKSDLELVKALRGGKFTVDDEGGDKPGSVSIAKAYKGVGKRGGSE